MKIENEIEKSKKRIKLLEGQNACFRKLLDSALEVTKKPGSALNLETEFWQETIKLIENEKVRLQEEIELLEPTENELVVSMRKLENDNIELHRKVDILLEQVKKQEKEIEKLKTEHAEVKFFMSQPEAKAEWCKTFLQLDESLTPFANSEILEERQKLQRKILNLDQKKNELLCAIEEIANPDNTKKLDSTKIKLELEKALFKAIDEVARRDFESLHLKVLDLERERAALLNELQAVMDDSRKKIAEEYCQLQETILEIEKKKESQSLGLKSAVSSEERLNHVIEAFSNDQKIILNKTVRENNLKGVMDEQGKASTCTVL